MLSRSITNSKFLQQKNTYRDRKMRKYISYFKLRFNTTLQYRASAIAGIFTQFFWGIMQILIYIAFYKTSQSNSMLLEQLISYIWLKQAFYSLINNTTDSEIRISIEKGNIAYELNKPLDIYWMWFSKTLATRFATASLKCFPLLIVTTILPMGLNLKGPISIEAFLLFVLSLFIGMFIMAGVINLFYISIFYTTTAKGTLSIFYAIVQFFGGGFIPVALMPSLWQKICYIIPIGLVGDLPFRIYTGNISIQTSLFFIGVQLVWIIALVVLGKTILKNRLKKVVIQGG